MNVIRVFYHSRCADFLLSLISQVKFTVFSADTSRRQKMIIIFSLMCKNPLKRNMNILVITNG